MARIEGTRPGAPTLLLMGHTDVVPANPAGWRREPFGGELVDGEVWGRGAIDMLNLTASMAVATRRLAAGGFRPEGTLVYLAVADEEALGTWGADHLARHQLDAVGADYVITESGGIPVPGGDGGLRLPVLVGEKGSCWCTLRITGTPGHASQPYATDNALVTAASVVQRLADYRPETRIHDTWRLFLEGLAYPQDIVGPLLDPDRLVDALPRLPGGDGAAVPRLHAHDHRPHGGARRDQDQRDPRPGRPAARHPHAARSVAARRGSCADEAPGDLADCVELIDSHDDPSTESPVETALWDTLARTTQAFYEGSHLVPMISVGADRRPLLPPARHATATASACSARSRPSRTTAACSTATTSAPTSSRCGCRRSCGRRSPATCSSVERGRGSRSALRIGGLWESGP